MVIHENLIELPGWPTIFQWHVLIGASPALLCTRGPKCEHSSTDLFIPKATYLFIPKTVVKKTKKWPPYNYFFLHFGCYAYCAHKYLYNQLEQL